MKGGNKLPTLLLGLSSSEGEEKYDICGHISHKGGKIRDEDENKG